MVRSRESYQITNIWWGGQNTTLKLREVAPNEIFQPEDEAEDAKSVDPDHQPAGLASAKDQNSNYLHLLDMHNVQDMPECEVRSQLYANYQQKPRASNHADPDEETREANYKLWVS